MATTIKGITGDPMSRTAGADFRAILEDDIASATRGLQLASRTGDKLVWTIQTHAKVNLFASAVIVVAAARMLIRQSAFRFEDFTVAELHAIRRDPSQLTRSEIDAHLSKRDRATPAPRWAGKHATGTMDTIGGITIRHEDGTTAYIQPGDDANMLAETLDTPGISDENIDVLLTDLLPA